MTAPSHPTLMPMPFASVSGGPHFGGIYLIDRLKISGNKIYTLPSSIGLEVASGAFTNTEITDNLITGGFYWSGGVPAGVTVWGNRIYTTNAQTGLFANIQGSAAAQPTSGTFSAQAVVLSTNITSGTPIGWVCTIAGTMGTYSEGLTATANGTHNVTLSGTSTVLHPGDWLTINGVSKFIVSISGTALVMSDNITTGSALAITYYNASWKALPNIT